RRQLLFELQHRDALARGGRRPGLIVSAQAEGKRPADRAARGDGDGQAAHQGDSEHTVHHGRPGNGGHGRSAAGAAGGSAPEAPAACGGVAGMAAWARTMAARLAPPPASMAEMARSARRLTTCGVSRPFFSNTRASRAWSTCPCCRRAMARASRAKAL